MHGHGTIHNAGKENVGLSPQQVLLEDSLFTYIQWSHASRACMPCRPVQSSYAMLTLTALESVGQSWLLTDSACLHLHVITTLHPWHVRSAWGVPSASLEAEHRR